MRKLSGQLTQLFKRIDGAVFNATLAAGTDNVRNILTDYRLMFVRKPTYISTGNIVRGFGGEYLILMDHPDDSEYEVSFKVAPVARTVAWSRMTKAVDPVSHALKDTTPVDMGLLYVNFDMPKEVTIAQMQDTRYRFIAGQDVQVGDLVDGKHVKVVTTVLGVKLGFAE